MSRPSGLSKYLGPEAELSPQARAVLERELGGTPYREVGSTIERYACADIGADMKLSPTWVALGSVRLALFRGDGSTESYAISEIAEVAETIHAGSVSWSLKFKDTARRPRVLRHTQRQKRAMASLFFALREKLEGRHPPELKADSAYAEYVLHAVTEAQASDATSRLKLVARLLRYLKPYRKRVVFGMAAASAMTLVSLVPPFLAGRLLDGVVRPFERGLLPADEASRRAWWIVGGIALAYLFKEAFAWVRFRTMSMLGELVARDLRDSVYRHLQKLSVSFFSSKQTGSLISRVTSDTDRIWDFIAFGVVEVSVSLILLLGLGSMLIWLDWRLGIAMTLPVPAILYAIWSHGEQMQRLFLRAWRRWSALTAVLSDTIPGVRVVKAFNQESREIGRFGGKNEAATTEFNGIHTAWTSFWPRLMLAIQGVIVLVWCLAVPRVVPGDGSAATLSAGTLVSFLFYMTMFVQPIEVIGQMARMLNRATSSAYRIFELLDTKPQILVRPDSIQLTPVRGRVTFEDVKFGYDGLRQILKGVSFDVQPGEMIGLVGPSGAGKSTLIQLLARFYEPTGGRVLIDGVDMAQVDTGHYRKQVGMVLQDPFLFHGSILDNIRYGMPDATLEDVLKAAKAANAHEFVLKLPHAYDTVVGERGHTLSGGERQRISIARAVLHDPRILILDEATSSVDTETERRIQEALDRLVVGRTVFAIAHRLSTLTRADRLFVVEDGRITEQGQHEELLAREGGTYRKLHEAQRELHERFAL